MISRLISVFASCLTLVLVGCASRSTEIIARCGPHSMPVSARKIAFMKQAIPSPETQSLERVLGAELEARGYLIVPQEQADLTINCRAEENYHRYLRSADDTPPYYRATIMQVVPGVGPAGVHQDSFIYSSANVPTYVEDTIQVRGIRLQVFPTQQLLTGRFETAWEGYIEAGLKLRPEQQPELIHLLLEHFGRDFSGKVKLASQPD